jgi:penicillin amidase
MKLRSTLRGVNSFAILAAALLATRTPRKRTLEERLKQIVTDKLPVTKPVHIYWNEHHVPFVEAETDRDCAVGLGVVQAHLRLGQIEMMRRLSQGRASEMIGAGGIELDHALRAFHFSKAVPEAITAMTPETREWVEGFVDGINHYLMNVKELPPEFSWLGMAREPWTNEDIVTIGRMSGADVHWMIWLKLLRLRKGKGWETVWDKMLAGGFAGVENYTLSDKRDEAELGMIVAESRSGSNSYAVGGKRSGTGSAWIASDPHLPVTMPNIWLLAGFKCPTYHVIGLMLPALPFVALGRNPTVAWGGTNLHAASTDLIDISEESPGDLTTRTETIKVRGGKPVTVTVRESRFGPVISDASLIATGDQFALKWAGHIPTDEIGGMLGFNRAQSWEDFGQAADMFGVPGQNFVYADVHGNVGKLIASLLPKRKNKPSSRLLSAREEAKDWDEVATSKDLPRFYNPEQGFVASANDEPPDVGFPIGFFYSSMDRVRRISQVLAEHNPITLDVLSNLQRDVSLKPALSFRDLVLERYDHWRKQHYHHSRHADRALPVIQSLREWDGSYAADSAGALAFETIELYLLYAFHPPAERTAFSAVWHMRALMERTLREAPVEKASRIVAKVVERALSPLEHYKVWGEVHRMRLRHPLASLPLVGHKFQYAEWPGAGNEDTVMKAGVPSSPGVHGIPYGSIARHISDLSHPDENYFTVLGGQDGWIGSDTMLDQVPFWRQGKYIKMPMRMESVRQTFLHHVKLTP